jgi:hypothetical protein
VRQRVMIGWMDRLKGWGMNMEEKREKVRGIRE